MIELKPGVRVTAMSPQIGLAIQVAASAWTGAWDEIEPENIRCIGMVVTSINDSLHARTSLHYIGHACDIRTKTLPTATAKRWFAAEVRRRLGVDFDVVLEGLGTHNEHLHVEHQPKGAA